MTAVILHFSDEGYSNSERWWMTMLKVLRILVPVDFTKESALALEWAEVVAAKKRGATIYLLHVMPPTASSFGTVAYKAEQEAIDKKLLEARKEIPEDILSFGILKQGKIPAVIAQVCEEKDIDLVVMTTRGRRGLKHFLPESVTEDTVRLAACPVLVLHLNTKNQPANGPIVAA